jgi:WD40 repeat protein
LASFRPDGRQIVYADDDGNRRRLRIWDVANKQEVASLPDAGRPVAWSPDGGSLAYCTRSGDVWSVRSWDLAAKQTRTLVATLPANREPNDLAFSPTGQKVAARISFLSDLKPLTIGAQVIGWDVATGQEAYRVADPSLAFPLEAASFISAEYPEPFDTAIVYRWDYDTGTELGRFTLTADGQPNWWFAHSPQARLYLGQSRHENLVMELISQRVLGRPPGEWMSIRPLLFDSDTGQTRYRLPMALNVHFDGWSRSRWSPDGTLLAIAGDEQVAVWDIPPR